MVNELMPTDHNSRMLLTRLSEMFAPDEIDDDLRLSLSRHIEVSVREASFIQCVGMRDPIPLQDLYQTTRFRENVDAGEWIRDARCDAIVFAGPGQGKTTFLKHVLVAQAKDEGTFPLLLTLRSDGAIDLLAAVVSALDHRRRSRRVPFHDCRILFLVDGYDEIDEEGRQRVAKLLKQVSGLRGASFMLACRTAYAVQGVVAKEVLLADFDARDAERFVDCFSRAYGAAIQVLVLSASWKAEALPIFFATH